MSKLILSFLLIFLICLFNSKLCVMHTLPLSLVKRGVVIDKGATRPGIEVPPPEILRFMRRFGYLEPNPSDSEALYHESAIVEAVKNIQKYGALNQTGKLDNETLELLTKPRCGVPDIEATPYYLRSSTQNPYNGVRRKRYVIGAKTWSKRRITYFIANWSSKIPQKQIERDLRRAFDLWSRYSGLKFRRINSTAADIIVGFGSNYHGDNFPFDGPGNILAHAFYPYEMGSWGGDVHFDEDENWQENSTNLANGVDFFAVTAHELGHSLGLAHSPFYASIMFPYYKGPEESTLSYDDTMAMYEMYLSKQLDDDMSNENTVQWPETTTEMPQTDSIGTTTEITDVLPSACEGDCVTMLKHEQNFNVFQTYEASQTTAASPTTTIAQPELFNVFQTYEASQTTAASPTTTIAQPELSEPPNICRGNFDAVSLIDGVVHIFKNEYVWKLTAQYTIMRGYPRSIYEMFPQLPHEVKRIDAAYVRHDGTNVFFVGNNFYTFRNDSTRLEFERHELSVLLGSRHALEKVDAVMLWPKNNYTYIFAGSKFWRYNDQLQLLDPGYPKTMQRWPGIPSNLDAAATLANGKTYFFKNNIYWLYNNQLVRPERGYPRRASTAWLGCAPPTKTTLRNYNTTVSFISFLTSPLRV